MTTQYFQTQQKPHVTDTMLTSITCCNFNEILKNAEDPGKLNVLAVYPDFLEFAVLHIRSTAVHCTTI